MAGFTQALEHAVLNHVFRNTPYTAPATVYAALFTAAPSDTTGGTEVSGGSYARVAITFGAPSGNPGQITNSSQISFPQATADWGSVGWAGVFNASTGGTLMAWGALAQAKTIQTGDQAVFNTGNFTIQLD